VNYGGRDEIRRAFCKIIAMHDKEKINPEDLTEKLIAGLLDTAPFGDPDLLIRTSGEYRVSNFLLWQISYAEFYTTDVLWPDFSPKHLTEAILAFQGRVRRRGG
jgi:undecaprenyl diphosphate synthase